jgi:hypothetical protein
MLRAFGIANPRRACQKEDTDADVSGMVRHYHSRDLTVVILSNLEDGAWEPIEHVHEEVMAGTFD